MLVARLTMPFACVRNYVGLPSLVLHLSPRCWAIGLPRLALSSADHFMRLSCFASSANCERTALDGTRIRQHQRQDRLCKSSSGGALKGALVQNAWLFKMHLNMVP